MQQVVRVKIPQIEIHLIYQIELIVLVVHGPPCNPLLAAGLIPKTLEDILQVPVLKEKKISRRINTKARVITGEEYVEEIRKKEEEIQKIEQEKQRRKREREEKRAAKELEKRRKELEKSKMPMGQQRRKVNLGKCANSDQSLSIAAESNQGPSESSACSAHVRRPTTKVLETSACSARVRSL